MASCFVSSMIQSWRAMLGKIDRYLNDNVIMQHRFLNVVGNGGPEAVLGENYLSK